MFTNLLMRQCPKKKKMSEAKKTVEKAATEKEEVVMNVPQFDKGGKRYPLGSRSHHSEMMTLSASIDFTLPSLRGHHLLPLIYTFVYKRHRCLCGAV
jgi:hypothetical protein